MMLPSLYASREVRQKQAVPVGALTANCRMWGCWGCRPPVLQPGCLHTTGHPWL